MKEKTADIDILEELANNEHIRWSNWQKYVHSKCIKNEDGSLTIPKEYVEHWEYEINTDYDDLPDNIKESDRREVRQILEKLKFSTLIAENKEVKEKNKEIEEEDVKIRAKFILQLDNYILKSKVEEKIEELSGMVEVGDITREMFNRIEYAIEVLLELLDERNNTDEHWRSKKDN